MSGLWVLIFFLGLAPRFLVQCLRTTAVENYKACCSEKAGGGYAFRPTEDLFVQIAECIRTTSTL